MFPVEKQVPFMNAFYVILQWAMNQNVHVIFQALKTTIRMDPSDAVWKSPNADHPDFTIQAQRVEHFDQIQGVFGQAQKFHLYTGSPTDPELIDRDALLVRIGYFSPLRVKRKP